MPPESCEVQTESTDNLEAAQVPAESDEVKIMDKKDIKDVKITRNGRTRKKGIQEMPRESSEVQIEDRENLKPEQGRQRVKLVEISGRDVKEISNNRVEDKENKESGEASAGDVKGVSRDSVEDKDM